MHRARPYLFLVAISLALTPGCEEAHEADLLDVTSVGPDELGPGHPLVVEGGPFAIHHPVSVRLVGELARPFEASEPIREDFPAQAVAEDRIEVRFAERTLTQRFGRSTFHGRIEVREEAEWEGLPGAVLGRASDVSFDLVPARAIDADGRSLDRVLGLTWAAASERGLEIASVEPDGRAAGLGLAEGDVVVRAGDARFVRGDAPVVPPDVVDLALVVARAGEAERDVACVIGDRRDDEAAYELAHLIEVAILLGWIALLRSLPLSSLEYASPRPASALTRPSAALVARAAGSVVLAYALVRVAMAGVLPSAPFVIAAVSGLRAALCFADARGDVRALPTALGSGIGLAAGLSVLPVALGDADLAALARDGGAGPLAWPIFAQPAGPIALALVGVSVASVRMSARPLAVADDLLVLGIGSLVAIEGTAIVPSGRAGLVAVTLTSAIVTWVLAQLRGRAKGLPAGIAVLALVALSAISLGAWTMADPSALDRATMAETVLGMCITLAIALVHRATSARAPARVAHALL